MDREGYHRIGDIVDVQACIFHPAKSGGRIVMSWYGRDHGAVGPYFVSYWIKFPDGTLCHHPHQECVKPTENTPAIVSQ